MGVKDKLEDGLDDTIHVVRLVGLKICAWDIGFAYHVHGNCFFVFFKVISEVQAHVK